MKNLQTFDIFEKKASKSTLIQLNFSGDFLPFSNFVLFIALYLREKVSQRQTRHVFVILGHLFKKSQ